MSFFHASNVKRDDTENNPYIDREVLRGYFL